MNINIKQAKAINYVLCILIPKPVDQHQLMGRGLKLLIERGAKIRVREGRETLKADASEMSLGVRNTHLHLHLLGVTLPMCGIFRLAHPQLDCPQLN